MIKQAYEAGVQEAMEKIGVMVTMPLPIPYPVTQETYDEINKDFKESQPRLGIGAALGATLGAGAGLTLQARKNRKTSWLSKKLLRRAKGMGLAGGALGAGAGLLGGAGYHLYRKKTGVRG